MDCGQLSEDVDITETVETVQNNLKQLHINTDPAPVFSVRSSDKMMEEVTDESCDSFDEQCDRPAERWAPLGAANVSPPCTGEISHGDEMARLRELEEEQEMLNTSLLSLTTHFAQVQFRLKQIISAPQEHKEDLLRELEEFAFKGIPDLSQAHPPTRPAQCDDMTQSEHDAKIEEQRKKQQELIAQLKSQLEDLEQYAYETGEGEVPSSKVMEKQKVVIDQIKNRLGVNDLEHLAKLSPEELRQTVDKAICQIVNPAKVKEKLVEQLKTQIVDLERFIDFLQGEATSPGPLGASRCTCSVHQHGSSTIGGERHQSLSDSQNKKSLREQTLSILRQTLTVLQIFAISQFGCGGREFQRNVLKRTEKANHWGDIRAKLEISITHVIDLHRRQEEMAVEESDYTSDSEDSPTVLCNQELTTVVRKELAMALKDLLQHGLMEVGQSTSLVPFGCFPSRSRQPTKMMHAWDLFRKYYEMKHGKEYNESPARKLSRSFDLNIVGGKAITVKQTLLTAIEDVLATHVPLKRSEDSQFKAFVCLALNQHRLVSWLRLVLRTTSLIEYYYQPWSYVMKTGFDDALVSLEKLSKLNFNLPVDLAVRPFNNIKDAF